VTAAFPAKRKEHTMVAGYVQTEHLYNIQCNDSHLHLRYQKLHTET
jgi:hypothetical protein